MSTLEDLDDLEREQKEDKKDNGDKNNKKPDQNGDAEMKDAEPEEKEEDLLDKAWGLEATSRLSCQVILGDDDLVIEIPKYTINQVSENH